MYAVMMKPFRMQDRQSGLSLVEVMIAMALGLVILGALTMLFINNNKVRHQVEQTSRQLENGRYAIQLMSEDVRLAGYLGSYVPPSSVPTIALPDPCSTTLSNIDAARVLHVQGYNNVAAASTPSCLTDLKSGTDILVVRRASACAVGDAGCDAFLAGAPHLQASDCENDSDSYKIDTVQANLTLRKVDCATTTTAKIYRYRTHIYFIAQNNIAGDGVPTLKRAELGTAWTIVPLVEGIENLQIQYGLDTKTDTPCTGTSPPYTTPCDDGSADTFAMPATVQSWWNVVLVKIALLSRDTEQTKGYVDTKTYTLVDQAIAAPMDAYRRHAYSTTIHLANAAGRRE